VDVDIVINISSNIVFTESYVCQKLNKKSVISFMQILFIMPVLKLSRRTMFILPHPRERHYPKIVVVVVFVSFVFVIVIITINAASAATATATTLMYHLFNDTIISCYHTASNSKATMYVDESVNNLT